jgi:hypothetical protein
MPHVWLLYDLPESKSYTETWKEIALFIQNVVDKDTIVRKAQRVHWDGSRDDIDEAEYILMSQAEVPCMTRDADHQLRQQMKQSLKKFTKHWEDFILKNPNRKYLAKR